jgi:hypothetical protein
MRSIGYAKVWLASAAVLSAALIASCNKEDAGAPDSRPAQNGSPARVKTVVYFLENAADHEATLRRCKNEPGSLGRTPECINAAEASRKIFIWGRQDALRRMAE